MTDDPAPKQNDFLRAYFSLERENDRLQTQLDNLTNRGATPKICDIKKFALTEPEPLPEIIRGLPCGATTLLAAHGGAGKSAIALRLLICVTLDLPFFGLTTICKKTLFLSCEDSESTLHHRALKICADLGVNIGDTDLKMFLIDAVGCDMTLYRDDTRTNSPLTSMYFWLKHFVAENGIEFVVIDGSADIFAGNENDRGQVKRFINAITALVPATGAVLLITHVNKTTANTHLGEGYSGSTAWHNSVRARWYLSPNQNGEGLTLQLQKNNTGKTGLAINIQWSDDAGTFVGDVIEPASEFDKRTQDIEEREAILAALTDVIAGENYCPAATSGPRTAYHVLRQNPHFPPSLFDDKKSNRKRFFEHLEQLRQMRLIKDDTMRRANRHTAAVIVPISQAPQGCANAPHTDNGDSDACDAGAPAPMRRMRTGGYRGVARAQVCKKCDGEGCKFCE